MRPIKRPRANVQPTNINLIKDIESNEIFHYPPYKRLRAQGGDAQINEQGNMYLTISNMSGRRLKVNKHQKIGDGFISHIPLPSSNLSSTQQHNSKIDMRLTKSRLTNETLLREHSKECLSNTPSATLSKEVYKERSAYLDKAFRLTECCYLKANISLRRKLLKLLLKHWPVYGRENNIGLCSLSHFPIYTRTSCPPIKEKQRVLPPFTVSVVKEQIDKWLKKGVITESNSPWAANLTLARKSDSTWRTCIDVSKIRALQIMSITGSGGPARARGHVKSQV